jgi:hypothetical protein
MNLARAVVEGSSKSVVVKNYEMEQWDYILSVELLFVVHA